MIDRTEIIQDQYLDLDDSYGPNKGRAAFVSGRVCPECGVEIKSRATEFAPLKEEVTNSTGGRPFHLLHTKNDKAHLCPSCGLVITRTTKRHQGLTAILIKLGYLADQKNWNQKEREQAAYMAYKLWHDKNHSRTDIMTEIHEVIRIGKDEDELITRDRKVLGIETIPSFARSSSRYAKSSSSSSTLKERDHPMVTTCEIVTKKGSTLHDFPFSGECRKCYHAWIVNVTPPGFRNCIHECQFCFAREAIYSKESNATQIYSNLLQLVEKDLEKIRLCPPIIISSATDPCQPIPRLREEVKRLVHLLMTRGVSYMISTKGDPRFLMDLNGFPEYGNKFVAISIEGTEDITERLSPKAAGFDERLEALDTLSSAGVKTIVRLDPAFPHLFEALYGPRYMEEIEKLITSFADRGCLHVVSSTGRISTRRVSRNGILMPSMKERVHHIIQKASPTLARQFWGDYVRDAAYSRFGTLLKKGKRLRFHQAVRRFCEDQGLTYGVCMELKQEEGDSPGIPHCEGISIPFTEKQSDGSFRVIPKCTANCYRNCTEGMNPPCGQRKLISREPYKASYLR